MTSVRTALRARNHYEVLGLRPSSAWQRNRISEQQIASAYRKAMLCCHPDKAGTDNARAAAAYERVLAAHAVLSDVGMRARYDEGLFEAESSARTAPAGLGLVDIAAWLFVCASLCAGLVVVFGLPARTAAGAIACAAASAYAASLLADLAAGSRAASEGGCFGLLGLLSNVAASLERLGMLFASWHLAREVEARRDGFRAAEAALREAAMRDARAKVPRSPLAPRSDASCNAAPVRASNEYGRADGWKLAHLNAKPTPSLAACFATCLRAPPPGGRL